MNVCDLVGRPAIRKQSTVVAPTDSYVNAVIWSDVETNVSRVTRDPSWAVALELQWTTDGLRSEVIREFV